MADLILPYSFVGGTLAKSSEVNGQFAAVEAFVEGSVMHRDASSAFTAVPSGPALDPSSDNQLARKAYVDRGPKVVSSVGVITALRTTTSTVFVDWPVGEVYSLAHTKRFASTQILISLLGTGPFSDTLFANAEFAVRVDGAGANTTLCSWGFNAVNSRIPVLGVALLSGLSASSHTYTLRAKIDTGTLGINTGDRLSFTIMEVN